MTLVTLKSMHIVSGWIQVVHPADMCFKLPENVTLEEGAMCEPLSVGVHACNRASVGPTTKVLILGAGPIGLVTLLTAHAYGSPKVIIADVSAERLKVAKELGANATVLLSTIESVSKLLKCTASDQLYMFIWCCYIPFRVWYLSSANSTSC